MPVCCIQCLAPFLILASCHGRPCWWPKQLDGSWWWPKWLALCRPPRRPGLGSWLLILAPSQPRQLHKFGEWPSRSELSRSPSLSLLFSLILKFINYIQMLTLLVCYQVKLFTACDMQGLISMDPRSMICLGLLVVETVSVALLWTCHLHRHN